MSASDQPRPQIVYYPKGMDEDTCDDLWARGNHAIRDSRRTPAPPLRPATPPCIHEAALADLDPVVVGENWRGHTRSPLRLCELEIPSQPNEEDAEDKARDDDECWEEKHNPYREFQLVEVRQVMHQGQPEIWRHTRCEEWKGKRLEALARYKLPISGQGKGGAPKPLF